MRRMTVTGIIAALGSIATNASATQGALLFPGQDGQLVAREASLDVPSSWQGVKLGCGGDVLTSDAVQYDPAARNVALAFQGLPYDDGASTLVLDGRYEPGQRYFGEAYTTRQTTGSSSGLLARVLSGGAGDLEHVASFYFGTVPTIDGVPVVTGRPADPNNPCPYGPCWTDGGVGRYLEYYPGGPIQNPGHAMPPAGFDRGVPYAWTREGQLDAQLVGTIRAGELQRSIDWYATTGWGFWLFPWAWA